MSGISNMEKNIDRNGLDTVDMDKIEQNMMSSLEEISKAFRPPDRSQLMNDINNTDRVTIKELKTTFIKPYFTCGTHFNTMYWLERGYTKSESEEQVYNVQSNNSNKFHEKRKQQPNKYKGWNATSIDYWLTRGYSLSDAKQQLKERQSTFSLDKLTSIYGKETAVKMMSDRNERWLNSL